MLTATHCLASIFAAEIRVTGDKILAFLEAVELIKRRDWMPEGWFNLLPRGRASAAAAAPRHGGEVRKCV
jgi:hypothetical protein